MGQIEDINKRLESMELLLRSINNHLARLANGSYEQDADDIIAEIKARPRLLTTKEASQIFGLSEYELRRGFKAGIYPAIQIGNGSQKYKKIKWRYDLLEETLKKHEWDKREEN